MARPREDRFGSFKQAVAHIYKLIARETIELAKVAFVFHWSPLLCYGLWARGLEKSNTYVA